MKWPWSWTTTKISLWVPWLLTSSEANAFGWNGGEIDVASLVAIRFTLIFCEMCKQILPKRTIDDSMTVDVRHI